MTPESKIVLLFFIDFITVIIGIFGLKAVRYFFYSEEDYSDIQKKSEEQEEG